LKPTQLPASLKAQSLEKRAVLGAVEDRLVARLDHPGVRRRTEHGRLRAKAPERDCLVGGRKRHDPELQHDKHQVEVVRLWQLHVCCPAVSTERTMHVRAVD